MSSVFRKILVVLPVLVLGIFYLYDHSEWYRRVSGKRLVFLALSLFVLYGWIFLETRMRKQPNFSQIALQSSFFVYIFMVLTLTGYFILFREISAAEWYDKMMMRIDRRDHVNLELFKIFKIYKMSNTQIVGNFIMLMPLGFYLPLLYRPLSNLFLVLLASGLISCTIEGLQLVTSFRSADVDDVLLNTAGAGAGFILYTLVKALLKSFNAPSSSAPAVS